MGLRLTQPQHANLSKGLEPYGDAIREQNLEQNALAVDHDVVLQRVNLMFFLIRIAY